MNPSCYFNFKRYIHKANTDPIPNKEWWESPFSCEYEILDNGIIKAKIYYPYMSCELEPVYIGGMLVSGTATSRVSLHKKRDLLIFDNDKCFLLKNAHVDSDVFTMECRATEYFISYNVDKNRMFKFFSKTKVKSIKIFAKTLDFKDKDIFFPKEKIPTKTFDKLKDKTYLKTLERYKHREIFVNYNSYLDLVEVSYISKESVNINKNNISKISRQIGNSPDSSNKSSVYIQIDLIEAVDPDKVYDYLEEIAIYFQLFWPTKIKIDHVYTILEDIDQEVDTIIDDIRHEAKIIEDDNCFEFVTFYLENFYNRVVMFNTNLLSAFSPTITKNILDFLKTCYDKIAYRKCDNYLREIKHFIFKPSLLIENWFLCCFKFIETFYRNLSNRREIIKKAIEEYDKKYNDDQNKENIFSYCFEFTEKYYKYFRNSKNLVKKAIEEYYYEKDIEPYGHKIIENATKKYGNYADCIVKLRNHYSHGGYYLPKNFNNSKKISERDVYNDFLRVLQRIAMNIIFKSILGYESHKFPMLAKF